MSITAAQVFEALSSIFYYSQKHLWCLCLSDSDSKLPLFGRALRSEIKLDPLDLLGRKYKVPHRISHIKTRDNLRKKTWKRKLKSSLFQVSNMLDDSFPARDFHSVVKPAIDDMLGREVTFDILFHNSEHQATLFRYGVKKSEQVNVFKCLYFCCFLCSASLESQILIIFTFQAFFFFIDTNESEKIHF